MAAARGDLRGAAWRDLAGMLASTFVGVDS